MAFLCLAVLRRASASISSSPPFMIKACCCADRSGGVKKPEQSWMRWPSKLNDLLTQIHWANTSVIYMEGGRGGSGWSLDFASVVCLLFMSDFKQGMNVYECMSTCVCVLLLWTVWVQLVWGMIWSQFPFVSCTSVTTEYLKTWLILDRLC